MAPLVCLLGNPHGHMRVKGAATSAHAFNTSRDIALLKQLAHTRLGSARAVVRLHEALCFIRAYPDDAAVLVQVQTMLAAFDRRSDLRRHRLI